MFKTKEKVYKEAILDGKSPEEAKKLAEEFENQKDSSLQEEFTGAEKSLGNSKNALEKSVEYAKKILDIEIDDDHEAIARSLTKSVKMAEDENFDAGDFFKAQSKAISKSFELIAATNEKIDLLAKSVEAIANAELENVNNTKFLQNMSAITQSEIGALEKSLSTFAKMIAKSSGSNLKSNLESLQYAENNDDLPVHLNKAQTLQILDKLEEKGEVSGKAVTVYESTSYLDPSVQKLVQKSVDLIKE